jgi:hypothetical protein
MQLSLGVASAGKTQEALTLIGQAGKIVRDGRKEEDTYFVNLHEGKYHICHAQALMATGHLEDAEEALQLAHETSSLDRLTDHNYIDILQVRLALQS